MNKKDLKFVERPIPGEISNYQHCSNLKIYEFAIDYIKDKDILECGFGEGYGADILSNYAKSIIGIDISNEMVKYAQKKYNKKNLEFKTMDVTNLTFSDDTFDIVFSNQLLEHIRDYEKCLSEMHRVTKPGGYCIIATPNRRNDPQINNPYHIRTFYLNEFEELCKKIFNDVKIFGTKAKSAVKSRVRITKDLLNILAKFDFLKIYRLLPKQKRQKAISSICKKMEENITTEDFFIVTKDVNLCSDFIGLCIKNR